MIIKIIFIFSTILPYVRLEDLKTKYQNDYRYYLLEKHGSILNHISKHHLLSLTTIFLLTGYKTWKDKKPIHIGQLPGLFFPGSATLLGERFLNYLGNKEQEKAAKKTTKDYTLLKPCFKILETRDTITEQDFIETLFEGFLKNQDEKTY